MIESILDELLRGYITKDEALIEIIEIIEQRESEAASFMDY